MTQDTTSCALDVDNEVLRREYEICIPLTPEPQGNRKGCNRNCRNVTVPSPGPPAGAQSSNLRVRLAKDQLIKITPALKLPILAGVSRKIRAEVLDTWYRCNRFCTEIEYRDADIRSTFEMHLMQLGDLPAIAKWIDLKGLLVQAEGRAMHRVYWRLYRREEA